MVGRAVPASRHSSLVTRHSSLPNFAFASSTSGSPPKSARPWPASRPSRAIPPAPAPTWPRSNGRVASRTAAPTSTPSPACSTSSFPANRPSPASSRPATLPSCRWPSRDAPPNRSRAFPHAPTPPSPKPSPRTPATVSPRVSPSSRPSPPVSAPMPSNKQTDGPTPHTPCAATLCSPPRPHWRFSPSPASLSAPHSSLPFPTAIPLPTHPSWSLLRIAPLPRISLPIRPPWKRPTPGRPWSGISNNVNRTRSARPRRNA